MEMHSMLLHPLVAQMLFWAQDVEARGFLRGIATFIVVVVVFLLVIGVVLGLLVARLFGRRRR
jgi:hypothetical protein